MNCIQCGKEIDKSIHSCPFCGAINPLGNSNNDLPRASTGNPPASGQSPLASMEIFERVGEDPVVRWFASLVDQVILGLLFIPVIVLVAFLSLGDIGQITNDPQGLPTSFFLILAGLLFISWILYFSLQEGIFGTTIGKIIGALPVRLKVIRRNGGRIGFGRALLRAAVGFFETNLLGAIIIWSTRLNQRLGDILAGTLVVDATKIRQAVFYPGYAAVEFVDGSRREIVRVIKGVITKWLGIPQWMIVHGLDRNGRRVRIFAKIIKGATVFAAESRVGQLRIALERTFQFQFKEVLEWWRILLVIFCFLVMAVCFGLPFLFSSSGLFEELFRLIPM